MGILRTTLVLGAVIAFMPSPPTSTDSETSDIAEGASSFGYAIAAAEAFSDVKGFCMRKPIVCDAAGHVAVKLEAKAKYSAKLIYEWANEPAAKPAKKAGKNLDEIETGSVDSLLPAATSPNREG